MSAAGEVSQTLKEALFETLSSILSPERDLRASAEQQLNILEVTDEFAIHLTELVLNLNAPLAVRQLASVLLKQYVESHWSCNADKFRLPETTPEAKAAVKAMLPSGLHESISKIRSSVAYAISAIAHWDWPEAWPELFDILMRCLMSENSFAVHGAMRVLTEVSRDVSDIQMPQFAPLILPEMLKIFTQEEKYSIRTRGRAVEIFTTVTEVIAAMTEYNKQAAKSLLFPILPQFAEALVNALKVPDSMTSDCGLKKDIIIGLKVLVKYFPKKMVSWLPFILTSVWNSLTESANLYIKTVVNDSEEANNAVDSDGEVLGFENLVFSIFDFIHILVESPKFRSFIKQGMTDLLHYILLYMQMTEDQIRIWMTDPDQFVEDEDEDTFAYSVRISAQDLLSVLSIEFQDETAISLCEAISKHIREADKLSDPHWWKAHEACMLALGHVDGIMFSQLNNNNIQFNLKGFLQSVVLEDLNCSVSPFLYGRCLWFASKFGLLLSEDLIKRFLQATVNGLQPSQIPCVRVSAVRAVWGFCNCLEESKHVVLIHPFLRPITEGLFSLAIEFSSEVLALVLEAIGAVLSVDKTFAAEIECKVSPLAIAVYLKHSCDPVLVTLAESIFRKLCKIPECMMPLQQRLVPTLVSIFQAPPMKVPLGLQSASIDILQTIVRNSERPLSDAIIMHAFPAIIHCIMSTDDSSILQNGGECLRAFVSVALDQITNFRDDSGQNGLDYIVHVALRLLDPKTHEHACAFVGGLVSLLICNASAALGSRSELLLRAVLSKMQNSEALSVTQSLIMVFAHLICHQIEPILDFLSGVPAPTGDSALQYVLLEWCNCHNMFFGAHERKVSTFALSKVLQSGLLNNDERLQKIQVRGDQIFNHNEGIKTRSKSTQNPDQWTQIPLFTKIYKMLIHELANLCDAGCENQEEESSEEEVECDGENNDIASSDSALVFSGLDYADDDSDYLVEDEDTDITSHPVYKINMKSYLLDYLQQLSQHPCYATFSQYMNEHERQMLCSITQSSMS